MLRQFFRLILFLLAGLWRLFRKHPAAGIGLTGGASCGFILGFFMVECGFPGWVLPANTVAWAVATAPVVKNYLDRLK